MKIIINNYVDVNNLITDTPKIPLPDLPRNYDNMLDHVKPLRQRNKLRETPGPGCSKPD